MQKYLRISYSILVFLCFISFTLYILNICSDLFLNLGTEIIGILLTIFLIDRIIKKNEENERKNLQKVVQRLLISPVNRHYDLWFNIYKATILELPAKDLTDPRELFNGDFYSKIAFLDITKNSPVYPERDWAKYIYQELNVFKEKLERIIIKYSFILESELLDLLENIVSNHFVHHIQLEYQSYKPEKGVTWFIWQSEGNLIINPVLEDYINAYYKLLDYLWNKIPEDKKKKITDQDWRDDVAPAIGSGRIDLAKGEN